MATVKTRKVEVSEMPETEATEEKKAVKKAAAPVLDAPEDVENNVSGEDTEDVSKVVDSLTEDDFAKQENSVQESKLTEEDDKAFGEQAQAFDAFIRRSVTLPGKKKQKALFRDTPRIVGDESGEVETYDSMKRKEFEILSDSAKAQKPKVLYGRISGVEEMEVGALRIPCVICHLIADDRRKINTPDEIKSAIYKIKIPAFMFFQEPHNYQSSADYSALVKSLDMRIGAVIEFIVYDINPDEIEVLASRINAMQIVSRDHYLGKRKDIETGALVKGYITYVNAHGISVDVFGADVFIRNAELAWRGINNALDERANFAVGKPVVVRVNVIERAESEINGQKYPYIKIQASIKDAYKNPNEVYFDRYRIGQKYVGQITHRFLEGNYIVTLGNDGEGVNGDRPTIMCKAPSMELGGTPYIGQKCYVAVTNKDADRHRFYGAFIYMEA